jgi:hypothetical protein
MYFAVSTVKLALLSVCSFGIYELVWFYRNWKLEKARSGEDLSPFWRTFFAPFYFHNLLTRMNQHAETSGLPEVSAGGLAAGFFVLNLAFRLPEPLWFLGMLSVVPILMAQRLASALNDRFTPLADRNSRFSAGNIVVLVLGGLVLALAIIGTLLPNVE